VEENTHIHKAHTLSLSHTLAGGVDRTLGLQGSMAEEWMWKRVTLIAELQHLSEGTQGMFQKHKCKVTLEEMEESRKLNWWKCPIAGLLCLPVNWTSVLNYAIFL